MTQKEKKERISNIRGKLNLGKEKIKKENAITLVALVITIIVLLILAGVTISALGGDNGILQNATRAKEETEEAEEKEGISLALINAQMGESGYQDLNQTNVQEAIDKHFGQDIADVIYNGDGSFTISFVNTNRDYIVDDNGNIEVIYWEEIMKNATPPSDQNTEGVIGLDSNGNTVNMDLWEYTLYNGTYALNDLEDLEDTEGIAETKGYLGQIIDGKIEGSIPKYIKASTDKEFIPVTSLKDTFINLNNDFDELVITPAIPSTVVNSQSTFSRCGKLTTITNLSPNTENMKWTFYECASLTSFDLSIPKNVTDMQSTFARLF